MTTQIQINFINNINGSLYGQININDNDIGYQCIEFFKKDIKKFIELDISVFINGTNIIDSYDDLLQFAIKQDNIYIININVIYDSIKKSQRLQRLKNNFNHLVYKMNNYIQNDFYLLTSLNTEQKNEYFRILRRNIESLMIEYDETKFKLNICAYLPSVIPNNKTTINISNLDSILTISHKDLEIYYNNIMSKNEFRRYCDNYKKN